MKRTGLIILLIALLTLSLLCGCSAPDKENPADSTPGSSDVPEESTSGTENGKVFSAVSSSSSSYETDALIRLSIKGRQYGDIRSDARSNIGPSGSIVVNAFEDGAIVPYDTESGFPTAQRVYNPTTFVHHIDSTSPILHKMALTGEEIDVVAEFYRVNGDGTIGLYYTVHYENAIVVGIKDFTEGKGQYESVSFTYRKVTYKYAEGGIEYSDSIR